MADGEIEIVTFKKLGLTDESLLTAALALEGTAQTSAKLKAAGSGYRRLARLPVE